MNSRLKDLREKNLCLAQEQAFIAVQPSWPVPVPESAAADADEPAQQAQQQEQDGRPLAEAVEQQAQRGSSAEGGSSTGNGALVPSPLYRRLDSTEDAAAPSPEEAAAAAALAAEICSAATTAAAAAAAAVAGVLLVERETALMSPYIQREVAQSGLGLPGAPPVQLPKQARGGCVHGLRALQSAPVPDCQQRQWVAGWPAGCWPVGCLAVVEGERGGQQEEAAAAGQAGSAAAALLPALPLQYL